MVMKLFTANRKEAPEAELSPLCLERQLCFAVYAASNQMTRLARPALDLLGLTYPQYLVMLVLWTQSPRRVSEIGAKLFLDSGTLTPLLKRMETNGLVVRTRDPEDERCVKISLSEKGLALKERARKVPEQMRCQIALSAQRLDSIREQLHQLMAALKSVPET